MQTQYRELSDLAAAVEAARASQRDLIADTRSMGFVAKGKDIALAVQGQGDFAINEYAHRQIAERIQVPAKYYDRMRTDAPDLLAANVNTWFEREPERRMVRMQNGTVRAFLSDKYQRIDNHHILHMLMPVLESFGQNLRYQSLALTATKMYLKITVPGIHAKVVGDIVEAGLEFRNGEIGNSRFEAWPFSFKLSCLNGARYEAGGFKKMHVGARADVGEDVYEMLSDETLKLDDAAFLAKVHDMVKHTLTQETFDKLVGKMIEASKEKLEGNPVKAVEVLGDSFGLNEDERGGVLRHLIEGGDLSRWGLSNAVTRFAQDAESYDRADELEGFGGKIVELPRSQWQELARAA